MEVFLPYKERIRQFFQRHPGAMQALPPVPQDTQLEEWQQQRQDAVPVEESPSGEDRRPRRGSGAPAEAAPSLEVLPEKANVDQKGQQALKAAVVPPKPKQKAKAKSKASPKAKGTPKAKSKAKAKAKSSASRNQKLSPSAKRKLEADFDAVAKIGSGIPSPKAKRMAGRMSQEDKLAASMLRREKAAEGMFLLAQCGIDDLEMPGPEHDKMFLALQICKYSISNKFI